ncbi:MAG TPA: YciI family protein [Pseudonocardiaceae bacterium]|jgi:hypothetical protein|nr:YciI family protein [Pseudonocardiaceae bacterium]
MGQYMLSVHSREGDPAPDAATGQRAMSQVAKLNEEMQAAGAWVFAGGLHPYDTATVVAAMGDDVLLTDGPFAESKEHLGGFWVISADDLDTALEWARKASTACLNPVEVRPFQDVPES